MTYTIEHLLGRVWTKKDGSTDQSMVNHCLKSNVYLDMGEFYLSIGSKPSITKDLYFSDIDYSTGKHAPAPENTFKLFKSYNMRMNSNQRYIETLEDNNQDVIFNTQYNSGAVSQLKSWTNKRLFEINPDDHKATPEQKQTIIDALKVEDEKYAIRLERYYKRYGKKVSNHTYWANR